MILLDLFFPYSIYPHSISMTTTYLKLRFSLPSTLCNLLVLSLPSQLKKHFNFSQYRPATPNQSRCQISDQRLTQ
uniref:Uncharacterized protein n=1 Tax=Glycine max TaxID=3847 RepID=A0A0R0FX52_SOYBN